jgi:hypothetical protein
VSITAMFVCLLVLLAGTATCGVWKMIFRDIAQESLTRRR